MTAAERLLQLLTDARVALWQEQHAMADSQHPRHKKLELLMRRLDREIKKQESSQEQILLRRLDHENKKRENLDRILSTVK